MPSADRNGAICGKMKEMPEFLLTTDGFYRIIFLIEIYVSLPKAKGGELSYGRSQIERERIA